MVLKSMITDLLKSANSVDTTCAYPCEKQIIFNIIPYDKEIMKNMVYKYKFTTPLHYPMKSSNKHLRHFYYFFSAIIACK